MTVYALDEFQLLSLFSFPIYTGHCEKSTKGNPSQRKAAVPQI